MRVSKKKHMGSIIKNGLLIVITIGVFNQLMAQDPTRWELTKDGGIKWEVIGNDSHMDQGEMSGF